jgi:hypothetical protein
LYKSCGTVRIVSVRGNDGNVEKCVQEFGGGNLLNDSNLEIQRGREGMMM